MSRLNLRIALGLSKLLTSLCMWRQAPLIRDNMSLTGKVNMSFGVNAIKRGLVSERDAKL